MAALPDRGVPLSTLSPKFLHTNSTSHTWPFSAIAELIDNAYDPDVSAKQFWIDKTVVKGELCLTFVDNGNGLNLEILHKMLSFGYSDKVAVNGLEPIGIYGNGFKSGAMRLGKDAIVFSRSSSTSCVGMLSQSYLEMIKANQIIVPIVCFEKNNSDRFSVRKEHEASLRDILHYSLFNTEEELLAEIDAIHMPGSQQETGTRIIIWNLRRTSTGKPEFDFDKDRYDIQIPSEIYETMQDPSQHQNRLNSYIPKSVYSLRAYCSILYLKPRMQVMVRGHKVKSELVAKSLAYVRKDHYKPSFVKKRIPITFGYNTKSKDQYGIMMYHKNRLIKAYERVGCQLKANNIGVGVIGVIECNFLDPTHNKQSFIESDKYRKTMMNLGIKLEEYWQEIRYRRKKDNPNDTVPVEDTMKRPDQNWAQCDDCLRWRKLPDGIDCSKLPDKWFCKMNPDPQFRSCLVEEEPEDSDDDQPSYRKTYKQQEREDRKKQEQKLQLELKQIEERRLKSLKKQGDALGRQHENLVVQLNQTSPSTPSTSRSRLQQAGAVKAESSPTPTSSHTGTPVTPYRSTGLPVITSVCSLSVETQRGKRTQPVTPQGTPKRPRKNGFCQNASTGDLSWGSSNVPVDVEDDADDETDDTDDDDDYDDDDEIVILETSSTPKPQKPAPSVTKIKEEEAASELATSMLLECTDDAAVDFNSEDTAAGPSTRVANSSTQTAASKVKLETESQSQPGGREKGCSSNGAMLDNTDTPVLHQQTLKQENGESSQSGNPGEQSLSNGVTRMESVEIAEPSYAPVFPDISVVQKQQDQLLELMQDTAQERDSLKEEVQRLNTRLQERVSVKRECSHQACQTEAQKDYRSLFEKAKKKVHDLVKDKEFLSNAADISTGANAAPGEEPDQEISLQVGGLVRELDQREKKMDELRSKLVSLEEEKSALAAQCEELRSSLQKERETAQSEEAGGSAASGSNSEDHESLIRLRKNVGRLLVSYIPDLDLEQVNYDCTVIDEILEQYVNDGCDAALPRSADENFTVFL